jgi:hypothetical protein
LSDGTGGFCNKRAHGEEKNNRIVIRLVMGKNVAQKADEQDTGEK